MNTADTKNKKNILKVRFLRSVKMGGRWFAPGDEVSVSPSVARELSQRNLVEKISAESTGTAKDTSPRKVAGHSAGNRARGSRGKTDRSHRSNPESTVRISK